VCNTVQSDAATATGSRSQRRPQAVAATRSEAPPTALRVGNAALFSLAAFFAATACITVINYSMKFGSKEAQARRLVRVGMCSHSLTPHSSCLWPRVTVVLLRLVSPLRCCDQIVA
jgi:hypothetical protein